MKIQFDHFKDLINSTKERFNLCSTDIHAIENLLRMMDEIQINRKNFDQHELNQISFLRLKQDLAEKSTKTDLIQMKIYIDNQMKKLLEINKENARELQRIQLLKTSTCHTRQIQSILSSAYSKPIRSYQTSRPYITFELDHIRKCQALIRTNFGFIPLYRRQAWVEIGFRDEFFKILIVSLKAAANPFPQHSLSFLRSMQNSLRIQINDLLGNHSSKISHDNRKKILSTEEILRRNNDVLIMGKNNQLYRGRIETCEQIPLKIHEKKSMKIRSNIEQKSEFHLDQSNEKILDEHLFEYLDWNIQFNEQVFLRIRITNLFFSFEIKDLPDELCEELFNHWTSIICQDQPCQCEQQIESIQSEYSSIDVTICLCSQCSCDCLKEHFSRESMIDQVENQEIQSVVSIEQIS